MNKQSQAADDIERQMEEKILQYQQKLKNLEKEKIQPITLSLIQKYSFTRQFKNQNTASIASGISSNDINTNDGQSTDANSDTVSQNTDNYDNQSVISTSNQSLYSESQNAEKMIYLKTIRLGFLQLGPKIENLDIFEHMESLYLQNNKFSEIGRGLQMNTRLQFLALQHNNLKTLEGIKHIKTLSFLDISYNQIEYLDVNELPENLMILKVSENPFCKTQSEHRKQIVLRLDQLEELDKIKVIQAERLAYKGLIKCDVEKLLEKYRNERQMKDAKTRMEQEMYLEYMDEIGVDSAMRMMKSLEEFSKMDEYKQLHKQFEDIMSSHKNKMEQQDAKQENLRREIGQQVNEVLDRYSRQGSRQ